MLEILEDIRELIVGNNRLPVFQNFARSQGFQFRRRFNPAALPLDLLSTQLFSSSSDRKAIKGIVIKALPKLNVHAQIFDLIIYSTWGKRETTVWLFDFDSLKLPNFHIQPKGSMERISGMFKSSEWSYVNEEFASKFNLSTTDHNKMQMLFTEQFADVAVGMENYHIEAKGKHLMLYRPNSTADIGDMHRNLLYGKELVEIIIHDDELHKRDRY